MNTIEKEREDRFVKMTVERIKKMIAEDIRTRKFFDGKTDLEAEARKLIHQARELARKEHEANRVDFSHLQYLKLAQTVAWWYGILIIRNKRDNICQP